MKLLYILLIMLIGTSLSASEEFKQYKFKSATIYYDVQTSSFDNNLNSNVQGVARLVFDNWGLKELKEEDVREVQAGDFNESNGRHTMTLVDKGTIFTVDFSEKKIYKTRDRDLDMAISEKLDLSDESVNSLIKLGANKVGKEKIAGYECDLWEYSDQQVCLYKGIPLKIVIQSAGFVSEKKAVQVMFDKPITANSLELPKFPIVTGEDYSGNKASMVRTTDYIDSIKALKNQMKQKGLNLEDANLSVTPQLEKDIINALGKRYLKKQKEHLPDLLEALRVAKSCIAKAATKKDAQKCLAPIKHINDLLGDPTPEYDFDNLDEIKKAKAIKSIDKEIKDTEVTSNCVNKFDKTTDVIICTEGKLNPQESSTAPTSFEQNSSF
ncbi:MAG TPA: hypothetical protein ENK74_02735 [Nitratifractor sp.]|nr:hypothetical protein [Nitratifractor sp.]